MRIFPPEFRSMSALIETQCFQNPSRRPFDHAFCVQVDAFLRHLCLRFAFARFEIVRLRFVCCVFALLRLRFALLRWRFAFCVFAFAFCVFAFAFAKVRA